jgi:hypothetical protein
MSKNMMLEDIEPYEFIEIKTVKPLFRKEQLVGITLRSPKRKMFRGDETLKIKEIKGIEIIGQESGRSIAGAAVGAVVGGLLTGGIGLVLGGALGAGKNEVPMFLHLRNGDKRYIKIKTKHVGKIEALLKVLDPIEENYRYEIDCSWCAEKILAKANLCKHCGKEVDIT